MIGGYGPCILMWNGSADTLVESNTFINCEQAIALGLMDRTPDDHTGGIVRNNFIYRAGGTPQGVDSPDAGIMIWDSPGTKVINNTVIQNGSYANAIEYRFDTIGAEFRNNLCDGAITDRGSGTSGNTVANNVTNAQASWFVNAATGNLRLSGSAPGSVVNAGQVHADVSDDYDGNGRGSSPDIGASELNGTPANQPPVADATFSGTPDIGNTLTLDGTGSSDPDSGPNSLSFAWTQVSGPSVSIAGAASVSASVTPTVAGAYTFRLSVDDGADTDTDDVTIDVIDPALTLNTNTWTITASDSNFPASGTRTLTYGGGGTLTVSVTAGQPWLSVSFDNGSGGSTLAPSASGTITATVASPAGLSSGNNPATITVTGNDGVNHQATINFVLNYSTAGGTNGSGGGGGGGGCCAAAGAPLLVLAPLAVLLRRRKRNP